MPGEKSPYEKGLLKQVLYGIVGKSKCSFCNKITKTLKGFCSRCHMVKLRTKNYRGGVRCQIQHCRKTYGGRNTQTGRSF